MTSKTVLDSVSPLSEVLPGAQFAEHHSGIVDAEPEVVWDALHRVRWTDLRVALPLAVIRGMTLAAPSGQGFFATFMARGVSVGDSPRMAMLVMIGKPWQPIPASVRVDTVEETQAFAEPGWLKYGMEWLLHPLPGGRTLVETRTLCQATDAVAHRRFRAYWFVIRGFSGLIRIELIAALRRLTAPGDREAPSGAEDVA